jgi:hypothetical protein
MPKVEEQRAWHDIVALDESWFYHSTDHESIWLRPGEKVPERTRVTVQCTKMMVSIAWNPTGFHVVHVLPNGRIRDRDFTQLINRLRC